MDKAITDLLLYISQIKSNNGPINLEQATELSDYAITTLRNNHSLLTCKQRDDLLYCLFAAIDEAIIKSADNQLAWIEQSSLYRYFNDTSGGEKYYEIASQYTNGNSKADALINTINYHILALGYQGKAIFNSITRDTLYAELAQSIEYISDFESDNLGTHQFNYSIKGILIISVLLLIATFSYFNNYYLNTIKEINYYNHIFHMRHNNDH